MLLVRIGNEEQKWEVMKKKKKLESRRERISEDLSPSSQKRGGLDGS